MHSQTLLCPKCQAPLPGALFNTSDLEACQACGAALLVAVFPAFSRGIAQGTAGETIRADMEAGCFFHPQKKAVVPCESCGRFLCALCDVELDGRHLCPACLEAGRKKGQLPHLETHRILYDNCALGAALLPLLVWPVTLVTAPIAIYVAIRYWKAPGSFIPRTHFRSLLAILIALLQMAGWAALGWVVFFRGK